MARGAQTLSILLLLGALGGAAQAQERASEQRTWFSWLTPFSAWNRPEPEPPPPTEAKHSLVEAARALKAREQSDLFRRISVCDRLRDLALQNNDMVLFERASQLEVRAWNVFRERTGNGVGTSTRAESDETKEEP